MRRSFSRTELVSWLVVLAVAWVVLAFSGYRTRDPDSGLHTDIEADQAQRPVREWIAPQWAGHWNLEGLYREHPVGTFVPPIVLARLGFPAHQAGYAVNALYQVLGLLLLVQLAACFVRFEEARPMLWLAQLLPIAFTYRVRANHEQAVLFFLLAALYCTERTRRRPAWMAGIVASALGMMLVKGVFALLVPLSCAAWLAASRFWIRRFEGSAQGPLPATQHNGERLSDRSAWLGVALAVVAIPVAAAIYEFAYRAVTGESFLAEYLGRQLGVAARQAQAGAWIVLRKGYNLGFYVARVLWFGFPWSLVLGVAAWRLAVRSRTPLVDRGARNPASESALVAVLAVAVVWLCGFSLSDRLADRFVFPVYYLVATAGAIAAVRSFPAVRRRVMAIERRAPFTAPALWLVLLVVQLVAPRLGLPYVNR